MTLDEWQERRLHIPEPTWVDYPILKVMGPLAPLPIWDPNPEFSVVKPVPIETLERKLFQEGSMAYYAWTYDGKTPLFPIPV